MPTEAVAAINALSIKFASQLYSADAEFVWRKDGREVVVASKLLRVLRASPAKAEDAG